jgi:hypothetical protein
MRKETRKVERTWQELSRDDKNEVKILKVVDFGLTRSARRMPRSRQASINHDLLTTPHLARTSTRITLEENKNKHEQNSEVVRTRRKKIDITPQKLQDHVKMTSSRKVKTASKPRRQTLDKKMSQSPNLKRLQKSNLTKTAAGTSLLSPKPENSRVMFRNLLLSWEEYSTRTKPKLTSAVTRPKLDAPAESQSNQVLQNQQEKSKLASNLLLDAKIGKWNPLRKSTNDKP